MKADDAKLFILIKSINAQDEVRRLRKKETDKAIDKYVCVTDF